MSDTPPREIEAKFEVSPEDRERLASLDSVASLDIVSRSRLHQVDTYYDTPDARLSAAKSSLRIRRSGDRTVMTFKGARGRGSASEAHIASRLEDEVDLSTDDIVAVDSQPALPDELEVSPLRRARGVAGGPLVAIARLDNHRTAIVLGSADGSLLELAIDHCTGTRFADGREVRFDEVELEAKSAGLDELLATADALRALAPSLRPSQHTKLQRTLG